MGQEGDPLTRQREAAEADRLQPLGPEALGVRRTRVVLESLGLVVVGGFVTFVVPRWVDVGVPLWVLPVLVAGAGGWGWWWAGLEHSRWAWRLTDDLLEVRRGVVVRRVHLVPRSRIQNVTTTAGPLQSRFGVLTLTVHTAGARTRNVSIEDIDAGHAESIRRRLGLI